MIVKFFLILIHLPELLWYLCLDLEAINYYKEIAEKPFVCPNCGSEFHAKWHHLFFFSHGLSLSVTNKVQLKCPHCKETDACRWTGVDRI